MICLLRFVLSTLSSSIINNFPIPKDVYFDFKTLKKLDRQPVKEKCCTLWDDFTHIYHDGIIEGAYKSIPYEKKLDVNWKTNPFKGDSCIKIDLKGWEVIQFGLNYPARADQYTHIHFAMKTEHECKHCFLFRGIHTDFDGMYLSTDKINEWKEYTISFKDLHIQNNSYWGFWGENMKDKTHTFYFDEIYLIKNPNAPDASQCWKGIEPQSSSSTQTPSKPQNGISRMLILLSIFIFLMI